MASKRMFSKQIVETDAFLDMPKTSQLLYFHLNMEADDDGFVASPKKVMRIIGSGDDDFKILISKRFIIPFESGVCVIKHWLIHNYIRKDTYTETKYLKEKSSLIIKENGGYTDRGRVVDGSSTQVRLGKVSKEIPVLTHGVKKKMKNYKENTVDYETGEIIDQPIKANKNKEAIRLAQLFDKMATKYSKRPIATPKSYFIVMNALNKPHELTPDGIEQLFKDWFENRKTKEEDKVKLSFALSANNINAFKVRY